MMNEVGVGGGLEEGGLEEVEVGDNVGNGMDEDVPKEMVVLDEGYRSTMEVILILMMDAG